MRKKYQYIIECNGSGGELSIHSITQEFFDFMDAMSEDEKNDCITKLYQDQASLESLPQIKPDQENNEYFEWHEGDIKHVSLPSEIELSVFEVPEGHDVKDNNTSVSDYVNSEKLYTLASEDITEIYSLECYNEQGEGDPTIGFYSSAKGFMGNFILETNEPFDPKYLFKGQIESNLDFFINVFFYGRTIDELEQLDWNDGPEGEGKSLLHNLGYVNREWLDTPPEDIKKLNSAKWLFEDLE